MAKLPGVPSLTQSTQETEQPSIATGRSRLTPELRDLFKLEIDSAHARSVLRRGLLGVIFFAAWLGIDFLLTPDVFILALILRLGVGVPLAAIALAIIARNPPPFWREALAAAVCVLGAMITVFIMVMSDSPARAEQLHFLLLFILYLVVVLGLRFPFALAASAAILATQICGLLLIGASAEKIVTNLVVLAAVSVLSLIAANSFERGTRTAYLSVRRQRERFDKLEDLSRHDPLTGLGNRRALDDALAALTAAEAPRDIAIIVADIDHFKSYNDALGHIAGDQCLKRVAAIIAAELRAADRAVRFGGEEFLILLSDADLWAATAIAERIRLAVEAAAIANPGRPHQSVVTVSLGLAGARLGTSVTPEELIRSADAALYAAKNAGRNQVWPRLKRQPGIINLERRFRDSPWPAEYRR